MPKPLTSIQKIVTFSTVPFIMAGCSGRNESLRIDDTLDPTVISEPSVEAAPAAPTPEECFNTEQTSEEQEGFVLPEIPEKAVKAIELLIKETLTDENSIRSLAKLGLENLHNSIPTEHRQRFETLAPGTYEDLYVAGKRLVRFILTTSDGRNVPLHLEVGYVGTDSPVEIFIPIYSYSALPIGLYHQESFVTRSYGTRSIISVNGVRYLMATSNSEPDKYHFSLIIPDDESNYDTFHEISDEEQARLTTIVAGMQALSEYGGYTVPDAANNYLSSQ